MWHDDGPDYDELAAELQPELPVEPRIAVIGSTSFYHQESEDLCIAIGTRLAAVPKLALLTGGMPGIAEAVARAFLNARKVDREPAEVVHLLPQGTPARDFGRTIPAGEDMSQRREILARVARVYLCLEGGPGTAHEGGVAIERGKVLLPVARSGGFAGEVYSPSLRPEGVSETDWGLLANASVSPTQVVAAIERMVRTLVA